jgi:Glycosyl transferase family 2
MIDAVGVVIPVHNEETRIGACLDSVRQALSRLPDRIDTAVTVVLDCCADRTGQVVGKRLSGWSGARMLTVRHRPGGSGVGLIRDVAIRDVLRELRGTHVERTWLLSTDADTTVPPNWALEHLRYASAGAHGVAGLVDLRDETLLDAATRARYLDIVSSGLHGQTHSHVYAANLGVRADAYLCCGGFPARGHGEEHHLWHTMTAAGCNLRAPTNLRVATSARLHGRARGGLADLLQSLEQGCASELTSDPTV